MNHLAILKAAMPGIIISFLIIGVAWWVEPTWKELILIVWFFIVAREAYLVLRGRLKQSYGRLARALATSAIIITALHLLILWFGMFWGLILGVGLAVGFILYRSWGAYMEAVRESERVIWGATAEERRKRRELP